MTDGLVAVAWLVGAWEIKEHRITLGGGIILLALQVILVLFLLLVVYVHLYCLYYLYCLYFLCYMACLYYLYYSKSSGGSHWEVVIEAPGLRISHRGSHQKGAGQIGLTRVCKQQE